MLRNFTCIMCPKGYDIAVTYRETEAAEKVIEEVSGNQCKKGREYVCQELMNPMRNIASSVLVKGGVLPLASVRLSAPIPKTMIFPVMEKIKKLTVCAPVAEGQIVIENVLGLGSDVIVTKDVESVLQ